MYRMLYEEGKNCVNVVVSQSMEIGGISKKRDTVRFPVCLGQEDSKHVLLNSLEMRFRIKEVISRK